MKAILYSGTGNLLWLLEIPVGTAVFEDSTWTDLARRLCQEEGDGVMLLEATKPYRAYFINPDGSDGVFCGNGLRCTAYHLAQYYQDFSPVIEMAGQKIKSQVRDDQVMIRLPTQGIEFLGLSSLQVFEHLLTGFRVNMPNPHWVIFGEVSAQELQRLGAKINELYEDQGGINVEFVFLDEQGQWQARVYERGAGLTKACGSGAMAVLWVMQKEGLIQQGQELALFMPGGLLRLKEQGSEISLQGQVITIKEEVL